MSCLCTAGCFSYGESPRTPPLEGTSLHRRNISVERPLGILSLFTTCLPLWVKSSHQSRCHTSPTQELIACILRRQSSAIYREKKSAGEEDPWKSPEQIKKNESLEKLKSTESLKRERPSNNPPKITKYIKHPCKVLTTEPLKTGRPKNESKLKKLTSVRILQRPKQNRITSNKNWVKNGQRK